ncbi:MAG TPA: glycosyl hydrolase family 65 protein, partial [Acidimicrobiales bacterium]|nr:glycosyl hydrolase family 65 protein [Acidimicrobiales bacterium]
AEGFTTHQVWDFASTTPDQYPLLLHFPYFDLYRKQVVKQADLVLAMHVRGDAFTEDDKLRNFVYYEQLTVRDSSLSACTQAVVAAETGHLELAYDYLAETALLDLNDLQLNTRNGLHMAALAGTWLALVAGFGGMRDHDGRLTFSPRLPQSIGRLVFNLRWRGSRLRVELADGTASYLVTDGGHSVQLWHNGEALTVTDQAVRRPMPIVVERARPASPLGRAPARRKPAG